MRTVTENYIVYKYDEMDEDMKEKVLENLWNINIDYDWWDGEYHLGLSSAEIKSRRMKISDRWWESHKPKDSRGNIIGEYPCHTGLFQWDDFFFSIDRGEYIQFVNLQVIDYDIFRRYLRIPKRLWENICWSFENISQGAFYNKSTRLVIEPNFYHTHPTGEFTERQQGIVDRAMGIMNDHIDEALTCLKNDYDYLQTREAIEEAIESNDYEFTAEGEIAS